MSHFPFRPFMSEIRDIEDVMEIEKSEIKGEKRDIDG